MGRIADSSGVVGAVAVAKGPCGEDGGVVHEEGAHVARVSHLTCSTKLVEPSSFFICKIFAKTFINYLFDNLPHYENISLERFSTPCQWQYNSAS